MYPTGMPPHGVAKRLSEEAIPRHIGDAGVTPRGAHAFSARNGDGSHPLGLRARIIFVVALAHEHRPF